MRQHRALRPAGGARGVEDHRDVGLRGSAAAGAATPARRQAFDADAPAASPIATRSVERRRLAGIGQALGQLGVVDDGASRRTGVRCRPAPAAARARPPAPRSRRAAAARAARTRTRAGCRGASARGRPRDAVRGQAGGQPCSRHRSARSSSAGRRRPAPRARARGSAAANIACRLVGRVGEAAHHAVAVQRLARSRRHRVIGPVVSWRRLMPPRPPRSRRARSRPRDRPARANG